MGPVGLYMSERTYYPNAHRCGPKGKAAVRDLQGRQDPKPDPKTRAFASFCSLQSRLICSARLMIVEVSTSDNNHYVPDCSDRNYLNLLNSALDYVNSCSLNRII